jgi:hypothetical protein
MDEFVCAIPFIAHVSIRGTKTNDRYNSWRIVEEIHDVSWSDKHSTTDKHTGTGRRVKYPPLMYDTEFPS